MNPHRNDDIKKLAELIKDIRARYSGKIPVLALSMHDETLYAERVLHAGARGYIMKQESMKKVIEALRKILNGGIHLSEPLEQFHEALFGQRHGDGVAIDEMMIGGRRGHAHAAGGLRVMQHAAAS